MNQTPDHIARLQRNLSTAATIVEQRGTRFLPLFTRLKNELNAAEEEQNELQAALFWARRSEIERPRSE